jgi:hypothetical protein
VARDVSYIVLVLDAKPAEADENVMRKAVWGATVRSTRSRRELRWSDGVAVTEGAFRPGVRAKIQPGIHYLLVQGVSAGHLRAQSFPIPFSVEQPFPAEGQPCGGSADCIDYKHERACHQNRCRTLCASDAECGGRPGACGQPLQDARYCE